jgi:hypothetical protein
MAKSNRVKPNPASRSALADLNRRGILRREKVGIRNIVRASTGVVESVGLHHYGLYPPSERLPNFHPNAPRVSAWVTYDSGRAEITATPGHRSWAGTPYDLSSIFPLNRIAGELLHQSDTKCSAGIDPGMRFYGDAVLVTDSRMHWVFRNTQAEAEEIEVFDAMLSTPRQILTPWQNANPVIFFLEEPNPTDLVALKMRWA